MYGAADPALPRRCPPLTPRSLAAQALPPVLPPRRLVDRFLYDLFLLLFAPGTLALEDVVFDAVVFLRLLVVGFDVVVSVVVDNPGREVALLFLLPPPVDDFFFCASCCCCIIAFLLCQSNSIHTRSRSAT